MYMCIYIYIYTHVYIYVYIYIHITKNEVGDLGELDFPRPRKILKKHLSLKLTFENYDVEKITR